MNIQTDYVRGLVIYRENPNSSQIEILLLKKRKVADWSPPKGKPEGAYEDEIETSVRETMEETSLKEGDYEILNLRSPIGFEYDVYNGYGWRQKRKIHKIVRLWPARLYNWSTQILLSHEHEEYQWLPENEAITVIKHQYKHALQEMIHIINDHNQKCS